MKAGAISKRQLSQRGAFTLLIISAIIVVIPVLFIVLEIVLNGLNRHAVEDGMRAALQAATKVPGLVGITAANFGGKLGQHKLHLKALID